MGALYLKPLDDMLSQAGLFYARFMDDWVIIAPGRLKLRKIVKIVNTVLSRLKIEKHPDKTFILSNLHLYLSILSSAPVPFGGGHEGADSVSSVVLGSLPRASVVFFSVTLGGFHGADPLGSAGWWCVSSFGFPVRFVFICPSFVVIRGR